MKTASDQRFLAAERNSMVEGTYPGDRMEFTIDRPNFQRGRAKGFELEDRQADGSWQVVHQGSRRGIISSKTPRASERP